MTCDERRDLMLLYVADALDAPEQEELRNHLARGCPACAGALAEAQATFAAIPLALDPITAPPTLKRRLMDRVSQEQEKADRLPDNFATRIFRVLVPAAVAAGLAIVITHAVISQRLRDQTFKTEAMENLLTSQRQQIQSLVGELASQQRVVELLKSPDLKLVQLDGGQLQPNALVRILCDHQSKQWLLVASGMTALPVNKTYELWFIPANHAPVRGPTFNVGANGQSTLITAVPQNVGPITLAAITDEPAGGVDRPTGSIQLKAKVD